SLPLNRIEARYHKAKAQVDKLTQSILAKAFRGELVPQDLNDEPASELLKRTKAQKVEDRHPKEITGRKKTKA
ncbi:MAG: specificity determinant for hsdM and hsdR, partial [Deltaproteobacteria bacterium]|nr:specificity determinant for hsdM and hsdR [Deltaproteobacteria bacterium]